MRYLSETDRKAQQDGITGRRDSSSASLLFDYNKVSRIARRLNTKMGTCAEVRSSLISAILVVVMVVLSGKWVTCEARLHIVPFVIDKGGRRNI